MEGEGLGTANNHIKKKKINIFKGYLRHFLEGKPSL
jgi:hypothetical protein